MLVGDLLELREQRRSCCSLLRGDTGHCRVVLVDAVMDLHQPPLHLVEKGIGVVLQKGEVHGARGVVIEPPMAANGEGVGLWAPVGSGLGDDEGEVGAGRDLPIALAELVGAAAGQIEALTDQGGRQMMAGQGVGDLAGVASALALFEALKGHELIMQGQNGHWADISPLTLSGGSSDGTARASGATVAPGRPF